jgi:predicted transcriptional regulator
MSATLTIRLDDELERELEAAAEASHRAKGDIVREALRRQLALARFRSLRQELKPYAEKHGYLTDEDIFRDVS